MSRKRIIVIISLLTLIFSSACREKTQVNGVELKVTFAEEELSENLLTNMEYSWQTTSEFEAIDQDLIVFVHIWKGENLLIQDDHYPEIPTSSWEPNQDYSYTRQIYIPALIDRFDPAFKGYENLKLSVGFFSPYDRTGESKQEALEEVLKVLPQPIDTPEIIYEEGWSYLEEDPGTYLKQWRWTEKTARCIIDNPHRDATLIIKGGIQPDVFDQQRVVFKINNLVLDDFLPEHYFEKTYAIKEEMLGENDVFYLTIETDKSFIPAEINPESDDRRELGLVISFIYFR